MLRPARSRRRRCPRQAVPSQGGGARGEPCLRGAVAAVLQGGDGGVATRPSGRRHPEHRQKLSSAGGRSGSVRQQRRPLSGGSGEQAVPWARVHGSAAGPAHHPALHGSLRLGEAANRARAHLRLHGEEVGSSSKCTRRALASHSRELHLHGDHATNRRDCGAKRPGGFSISNPLSVQPRRRKGQDRALTFPITINCKRRKVQGLEPSVCCSGQGGYFHRLHALLQVRLRRAHRAARSDHLRGRGRLPRLRLLARRVPYPISDCRCCSGYNGR
mmetsp:Transcript_45083/g.86218  ORF Transcript_45083/g.86218 Transcript_45083/m.86218 type:complete len:273 (+) Transcript_45083:793-1611(+)